MYHVKSRTYLIYTEDVKQLSNYMKCINTEFAQYYNLRNDRVGFVFRDRFKSQIIHNRKYLYQCINYIHMNPVKAGIVKKCDEYEYSSYNDFCKGTFLKKKNICNSININEVKHVDNCSDFFDVDYNVTEIIEEYVDNYCKNSNLDFDTIKNNKEKREELINIILESGNISKSDIQRVLRISYWKITQAVENYGKLK